MSKESALKNFQVVERPDDLEQALSVMSKKLNLDNDKPEVLGSGNAEWLEKYIDKKLTAEIRRSIWLFFWLGGKQRHKAEILKVLELAAEDDKILAQLADDPAQVLNEFDLTADEYAALASGDIRFIEKSVGKLTEKQKTWLNCRLQQEKW